MNVMMHDSNLYGGDKNDLRIQKFGRRGMVSGVCVDDYKFYVIDGVKPSLNFPKGHPNKPVITTCSCDLVQFLERVLLLLLRSNPNRQQSKVLYRSGVRRRDKTGNHGKGKET